MKRISVIALILCAAAGLAACSGNEETVETSATDTTVETTVVTTTTVEETTTTTTTEATTTTEPVDTEAATSDLAKACKSLLGYSGTAGTSIKSASAAIDLLTWCETYPTLDADSVATAFTSWYDDLKKDDKEEFNTNWPTVNEYANAVISGLTTFDTTFSDAGLYETAHGIQERGLAGTTFVRLMKAVAENT